MTLSRKDFLGSLASKGLILTLPSVTLEALRVATKKFVAIPIYQNFIAGFKHHEGKAHLNRMQKDDAIDLVLEPENQFDSLAISIFWQGLKIGYLPMQHNLVLNNLLSSGLPLYANLIGVKPDAPTWQQVQVAVYIVIDKEHERQPISDAATELPPRLYLSEDDGDWVPA